MRYVRSYCIVCTGARIIDTTLSVVDIFQECCAAFDYWRNIISVAVQRTVKYHV